MTREAAFFGSLLLLMDCGLCGSLRAAAGSHLVLWLDAQDINGGGNPGSNPGDGTAIGHWADKSSHGNHAVQGNPDRRPIYRVNAGNRSRIGANTVRFDASKSQFLTAGHGPSLNLSQLTAFVVARAGDASANMWLFGKNHWGPPWTGYGIAVSKDGLHPWPHLGLRGEGISLRYGHELRSELAIVEVCLDAVRLHALLNGKLDRLQAVRGPILANDRDLLIGAGAQGSPACEFLQGDIAEILIYDLPLDPAQRQQTRQYLARKYGLTLGADSRTNVVITQGYLPVIVENPATPETRTLGPEEAAAALERDWLFQAEGQALAGRAAHEIAWARELATRLVRNPETPVLAVELAELDRLTQRLSVAPDPADARGLYLAVRRVKRQIMFKNPVVDFSRLLFIDQPYPQGPEAPHQAVHRLGHRAVPGGRLLVLDGLHPGGKVRQLAPEKPGSFWRPDLSFDAKRVLFCYKACDEKSFHLYEINLDGTGLRQLTSGDYDDLDPIYLPDGHLMFTTTRGNTYVRCGPFIYSTLLARCDADGGNIYLISQNNEPDWTPALLNDGRAIYSRWEYTDKPQLRIQSLWTTNQDGTNTAVFWGNQSVWPDHLSEPRPIPGSRRVMFSGCGHHDWFTASVGIVDPDRGFNYPHGLTRVTGDLPWGEVGSTTADQVEAKDYHASGRYTSYKTPYPLSDQDFLVSARGNDGKFRLYLMDVHGNCELIYGGSHNIWHAIPVRPRPVPPCQPDRVAWPGTGSHRGPLEPGVFFSANICQGVPDIPRGIVRYLRVIQMDYKTYSTWRKIFLNSGPPVSPIQEDGVKRVLSIVPVEPDGSVHFQVPPGVALYFQLLDEHFRCVQTMRSFTGVLPGEVRGCVGCHEQHSTAPPNRAGLALHRPPTPPSPPPWGTESIGYERFAQPVLDRYCGKCHQGDGEGRKKLDLTLRPGHSFFKEPYLTLIGSASRIHTSRPDQAGYGIAAAIPVETAGSYGTLRPMQYLSYRSKLVDNAMSGKHHGVQVDPVSLHRLITWVDACCPYLGEPEIRALGDPDFAGIEDLPIRPRVRTAPIVLRP